MGAGVALSLFPLPCPDLSQKKCLHPVKDKGIKKKFGGDLLSHTVARAVPSALRGLTAVFGMGTGVTLSLLPPKTLNSV